MNDKGSSRYEKHKGGYMVLKSFIFGVVMGSLAGLGIFFIEIEIEHIPSKLGRTDAAWGGLIGGLLGCVYGFIRQWMAVRRRHMVAVTAVVNKEIKWFLSTCWLPLAILVPYIWYHFSEISANVDDRATWCRLCALFALMYGSIWLFWGIYLTALIMKLERKIYLVSVLLAIGVNAVSISCALIIILF
jgi:hypothetical protein